MGNECEILLVDDNLINREVAAALLEDYGFEPVTAGSGAEAVELAKKTKFQIIFMDHRMPGMDGVEAMRRIRRDCGGNGGSPAIVALTAEAPEGLRERFLKAGFQDMLTKPLEREPLEALLEKWCPGFSGKEQRRSDDSAVVADLDQIRIEGIEIAEAKKHHTGGVENYVELLRLYGTDGRRKLPLLQQLLQKGDYAVYGVEVHALKSASANIGAMELSAQAKEQEEAAKRGDKALIERRSGALFQNYAGLLKRIAEFLEGWEKASGGKEKGGRLGRKEVLQGIRKALEQMEDFRSRECAETVNGLLGHELEETAEAGLQEIREQLIMYEDDEAERLLRELADRLEKEE
ncbi:MAG: response regulator [Roseburia sp.]|nr:response regulator [Roseburia sp.]MCM1097015.1 response regulator [Ruminococcus flavefaciens]